MTAATPTVTAEGEEPIGIADCAAAHVVDAIRRDPSLDELRVDDSAEIDVGTLPPGPIHHVRRRRGLGQLGRHFG